MLYDKIYWKGSVIMADIDKKSKKQDVIFISVVTGIGVIILSYGLYLLIIRENPGIQIIFFILGGFMVLAPLTIKFKNKWMKYFVFVVHLILLSLYAWIMKVDLEAIVALLFYWLIMLYIPYEIYKQKRTGNYFDSKFKEELEELFINPTFIEEKEESFKIDEHPYIVGKYDEGYIGDRIIGTYKDVKFDICEYHIQGKKDVWHGSILEIDSKKLDDIIIGKDDISSSKNTHLEKLKKSYGDIIWIVSGGKLSIYIYEFTPVFDTKLRQIKNPTNYIRILMDLVLEALEMTN